MLIRCNFYISGKNDDSEVMLCLFQSRTTGSGGKATLLLLAVMLRCIYIPSISWFPGHLY